MNEIDKLAQEIGNDGDFGIQSQYARSQGWDSGDPMTLSQAKRFSDAIPHQLTTTRVSSDDELFEIMERIFTDWPNAEVLFGGSLNRGGFIDAAYIQYGDIVGSIKDFEQYGILHFKSTMRGGPQDNKGIDPQSDSRITFGNECFRYPSSDDYLWISTDEFQFKDYPDYGKTLRLWWDD